MMMTDAFLCWCWKHALIRYKVEVRTRFVFVLNSFWVRVEYVLRSYWNSFGVGLTAYIEWRELLVHNEVNTWPSQLGLPVKAEGGFRDSNGIWTHWFCVSAAVLCLLSYEYWFITGEQSNLTSSSWKERNIVWKMRTSEIQWIIFISSFQLHWLHFARLLNILRLLIDHFRVPLCLCFKASLSAKPFLRKWLWFKWEWNCMQSSFSYDRFRT